MNLKELDRRLSKLEQVEDKREEKWFVEHYYDGCEDKYFFGMGQKLNVSSKQEAENLFPGLRINWIVVHHVEYSILM